MTKSQRHSFELLMTEHQHLEALVKEVEPFLDPDMPQPVEAIVARDRLAATLADHLAREDADIYPFLISSNDPKTAQTAAEFQKKFGDLVMAWTAYLTDWTKESATLDWTGFVTITRKIFARLTERIIAENALLYPAALSASIIVLRQSNTAARVSSHF